MRRILGTNLEVVRCTGCGWDQIFHGRTCSRCGAMVKELFTLTPKAMPRVDV